MSHNQSGFINCSGFELGYTIKGEGIPTLVIGSHLYYPRTFSSDLYKHLRMIFIDHRGFVKPPQSLPNSAYYLANFLDDVEYMRQSLDVGKCIIVGHSGHGYMALEYAKKYPENVSHVVLLGMGPDQSEESRQAADQYFIDSVCPARKEQLEKDLSSLSQKLAAHPDKRFITFCLLLRARSWYDFSFDATYLWEGVLVNMQIFDYVWGAVFRDIDITQGLENFDKPIFLGLGKYDFLVAPFFSWNPLRSQFKDLTIKLFEKSGHTPQLEESNLFNDELLQWIKK